MQVKNNLADERLRGEVEFIENCINSLPEEDYKVMIAVFVDKTSIRKMAESLFLSDQGLRKRLYRLKKTFAELHERKFK